MTGSLAYDPPGKPNSCGLGEMGKWGEEEQAPGEWERGHLNSPGLAGNPSPPCRVGGLLALESLCFMHKYTMYCYIYYYSIFMYYGI